MRVGWEFLPVVVFLAAMIWEIAAPKRDCEGPDGRRWFCNLSLLAINSTVLSAMSFILASAPDDLASAPDDLSRSASAFAPLSTGGSGVLISSATFVFSFLLLDCAAFLVHRSYHAIPLFWRFHAVHHSDESLDATTSVRHHFLEATVTFVALGVVCRIFSIPSSNFGAYGSVAMAAQDIQHANVHSFRALSAILSVVFVTPELHQIHHSRDRELANKNFGVLFSFWDRITSTQSANEHDQDCYGFGSLEFQGERSKSLLRLLSLR